MSQPKPTKKNKIVAELVDFVKMLAISLVVVYLCTQFFIRPVRVEGDSMYPSLHNNSVGFTNVLTYRLQGLDRFDVAIVYIPEKKEHLVKRVIGMPNETVQFIDDQLYINGQMVEEQFFDSQYKASQSKSGLFTQDFGPITLKENEYFLMGDNRPYSSDSRYYGPFDEKQIKGKDVVVLFPFQWIGVN